MRARARAELNEQSLERWWSKKYSLPPQSDLLQQRVPAELYVEYIADLMVELDGLRAQLKFKTGHERGDVERRIRDLEHVIERKPLLDEWEDALARGQRPPAPKGRRSIPGGR